MTPEKRRARSIEILKRKGVPYFEQLPVIESEEEINQRSSEEIAKRAIACLLAVQIACDVVNDNSNLEGAREFLTECAKKYNVENEFTDKEKSFFTGIPEKQEAVNMMWKYEAYWTLIWALGLIDELDYPKNICNCDIAIKTVAEREDFNDLMKGVKLRHIGEILDQADLIYRYHWACVDARINGREAPAGLQSGVVYERHCGLNWLIGKGNEDYEDWDEVATHT